MTTWINIESKREFFRECIYIMPLIWSSIAQKWWNTETSYYQRVYAKQFLRKAADFI